MPPHFGGKVQKLNPALPRKSRPHHFPTRLNPQPRMAQLKPNTYLLPRRYRGYHLRTQAVLVEIPYDAAVGILEREIAKGTKLVPMLRPQLALCGCPRVHTATTDFSLVGQRDD